MLSMWFIYCLEFASYMYISLQAVIRGFICRRRYRRLMLQDIDKILEANAGMPENPDAISQFFPGICALSSL